MTLGAIALLLHTMTGGITPVCDPEDEATCAMTGCTVATRVCTAAGQWGSCVCRCTLKAPCEASVTWNTVTRACERTYKTASATCDDGNACTHTDHCSGTSNTCLGTPITCAGSNPCELKTCNGTSTCSVAPAAAGTSCRASSGPCDAAETCNGSSTACPTNAYLSGTVCRPATGGCDAAEYCSGSSAACPTDVAAVGTQCTDNNACTTGDTCTASKTCVGTPKNVVDGNPCTADTCDSVTGVINPATPGLACDDGTACTTGDACTASKTCVGTPKPGVDDGRACTADSCNPSTGAITHTLTCAASATFYCHDKYGQVTRQVVCVHGQGCEAACP